MATMEELAQTKGCHCLAARRRSRAITRMFEERLREHGLRATQFTLLAALALMREVTIGKLAGFLDLERTTLTRAAALMERNGWVTNGEPDDARQHLLRLTDAGRRKLDEAYPTWREVQDEIDHGFAPTAA